jgi:hypothetical protein
VKRPPAHWTRSQLQSNLQILNNFGRGSLSLKGAGGKTSLAVSITENMHYSSIILLVQFRCQEQCSLFFFKSCPCSNGGSLITVTKFTLKTRPWQKKFYRHCCRRLHKTDQGLDKKYALYQLSQRVSLKNKSFFVQRLYYWTYYWLTMFFNGFIQCWQVRGGLFVHI